MFPTTGAFRDLLCPDNACRRPHCPFWHDPNPPSPTPPPSTSSEWTNPSYNPDTFNGYYNPGSSQFTGYNATVAPASGPIYIPQEAVGYSGYVATSDVYNPSSSTYTASYVPSAVSPPAVERASEPVEIGREAKRETSPVEKRIKQEVTDDDDCVIIEEPKKVKAEPVEPPDETAPPPPKKVKELPPVPPLPPLPAARPENILEAAKEVADIDAEIERLMQLRAQKKQAAATFVSPEKKKQRVEYVPKDTSKAEKRKAPLAYTPTPLAEIERQKEEKRRRAEERARKEKAENEREKAAKVALRRTSSSDTTVEDLFGEEPAAVKKSRTDSTHSTSSKAPTKPDLTKEKAALLNESRQKAVPAAPSFPSTSSASSVSKGSTLTPEQIAAAKQRVARPGSTNIIRASPTNRKIASAVQQMQARLNAAASQKQAAPAVKKPSTMEDRFGEKKSLAKGETRTARINQAAKTGAKPVLQEPTNPKVPMTVRLQYLAKMHQEFLVFLSPSEAKTQAEEEEKAVLDKVKHKNGYLVAMANALKRVRDVGEGKTPNTSTKVSHEQVLHGKAFGSITVNAKGPKEHIPVTEDRLYATLEENYLLTKEQLQKNSYPQWESTTKVHIEPSYYDKKRCKKTFVPDYDLERVCCRCNQEYQLNLKGAVVTATCIYHLKGKSRVPGKLRNNEPRYPCCGMDDSGVAGCQVATSHVSDTLRDSDLKKFVSTPPPSGSKDPRSRKIYALDCEMIYTVWGPALARVTVVDFNESAVFDEIVRPAHTVIDYNTTFSGITANQLETATYDLQKVHERLFHMMNSESILIGHSLESDLKAMRIVHERVVDTSVLYPHRIDDQKKRGLRELCLDRLGKSIQDDIDGHDSKEDSIAALQLVIHKVKFDGKI